MMLEVVKRATDEAAKRREPSDFARLLSRVRQVASNDPEVRLKAFLNLAKDGEFLRRHQWVLMRMGLESALGNGAATSKTPEQKAVRSESSKISRLLRHKEESEAASLGITREELSRRRIQKCMASVEMMIDAAAEDRARSILETWVCPDGTNLADCDSAKLQGLALIEKENSQLAGRHSEFYGSVAIQLKGRNCVRSISPQDFLATFDQILSP
jgi:hypothetical protein